MLPDLSISPFTLVLTVIRFVLVVSVGLHILLTKRNTASAIGWIGACVFMPLLGTTLYLMFGINRVTRLAKKLVGDRSPRRLEIDQPSSWNRELEGQFAPLALMVGKLSSRALVGGNSIIPLHDGDGAYPHMLDAIDKASKSILLCSYIFRDDKVGGLFADKLVAAHKRGVQVRVLVDGIGSGYFLSPLYHRLRRAGVPCARFMHSLLPWRMPFINLRDHRKILVVDGRIGFLGGLNIADENMVSRKPKHPVSDTHFKVEGPVVRQLAEAAAWDWYFTTQERLHGDLYFQEHKSTGESLARIVTAGPDTDLEKIEYTMLQAITLARKNVRLMTPYFLPGQRLMSELGLAALRGVQVDLVIPHQSNHLPLDWACAANIAPLLNAGVRVWLANPPFNHSKLMVVDRAWSCVGSSNLDIRSLRLNFEINMEIYDTVLAEMLDDFITKHRNKRLTHYDLDNRNKIIQIRDAFARLFMPYL
ncbi:cardiolipin synthetase [Acetobacter pasteurianus]|uniref:Cardiolipin synthase n=5 Tax=Acetobacter pasteurianus TaxID=438 RepID=A0A401WST8_ACEPA|nr:cardiolipin synthase [Acetobacter pasteurianus]BAU38224.1 cardiolipin synthase [Acetobacter pasteurianus NBRC 101655]ASC04310.1 Cardiolipin synthase [Acetobacter pasteurianus subsp. pasteurianus]OAZ73064.1 Cardiolipin synthase [Acetobacter pasteurianus]CCT60750.1 cardiolipin synthase [Acetobacter pasteurianus 386B]BAH99344.1 phospholipase D [Acetobacter pasteurianus IFO 3283-01]